MKTIKVNKQELLEKLRSNRAAHRAIFLEALDGYKEACTKRLYAELEKIKAGKFFNRYSFGDLVTPEDHTKEYDRAIMMLEMSVDDLIEVSEQDFAQYVMDQWEWKRNFLHASTAYSATAASLTASDPDM